MRSRRPPAFWTRPLHAAAAIRQDAAQKADKLKTERMQKAKADLAAAKQSAETAAAAEQRTAQQETAALAEDIRKKAQQNSAERNPRYPRGHHRLTRRQHERRGSPYGGNAYEAHQHLCAQEPS